MSDDELEEVILALKASGIPMPECKRLPDGSYLLYANGQKIGDIKNVSTQKLGFCLVKKTSTSRNFTNILTQRCTPKFPILNIIYL